jgi:hypothetical protein
MMRIEAGAWTMQAGLEGLGDAVTGGLIARAVEPQAGEADGHSGVCLNCGAALVGIYCHDCGQPGHVHKTLAAFWHELAHGVLHFEGKIWRTLPLLAWRPGELTRRYIAGERARFVSPMALFLFSVFLMFAIFSLTSRSFSFGGADSPADRRAQAQQQFKQDHGEALAQLAALRADRAQRLAAHRDVSSRDEAIVAAQARLKRADDRLRIKLARIAAQERQASAPIRVGAGDDKSDDGSGTNFNFKTGWPMVDAAIRHAQENPSLLAYKLQTNAYKFSWALIPISVPFVWLLFLHRRRYRQYKAYDHTVFVTYSIAFMSLGMVVLSLLQPFGLGGNLTGLAIAFVPPIHIYRQLRGAYQLSRLSALWRTFMLLIFAFVAATIFLLLLLMLGVMH